MRRLLPAVMLLLGVLLVPVTTAPAHADPFVCHNGYDANEAWAVCYEGTGTYRVVVECKGPGGSWIDWGPTVRVPVVSREDCGHGWVDWSSMQIMSLR